MDTCLFRSRVAGTQLLASHLMQRSPRSFIKTETIEDTAFYDPRLCGVQAWCLWISTQVVQGFHCPSLQCLKLFVLAVVVIFRVGSFLTVFTKIFVASSQLCYPAQYFSGVILECFSSNQFLHFDSWARYTFLGDFFLPLGGSASYQ